MENGSRNLPAAAERVRAAAAERGLAIAISVMGEQTRTAEEAARACACDIAAIVKSLVFRGAATRMPILLLVSGAHRVTEAIAAAAIGETIERPDAAYVREVSGFAIGGIPPFGHAAPMKVFMDRTLLQFDEVWAAGGTPNTLFAIAPAALEKATGARVIDVK